MRRYNEYQKGIVMFYPVLLLPVACVDTVCETDPDVSQRNPALWRMKSSASYRFEFTNRCTQIRGCDGPYDVFVKKW